MARNRKGYYTSPCALLDMPPTPTRPPAGPLYEQDLFNTRMLLWGATKKVDLLQAQVRHLLEMVERNRRKEALRDQARLARNLLKRALKDRDLEKIERRRADLRRIEKLMVSEDYTPSGTRPVPSHGSRL